MSSELEAVGGLVTAGLVANEIEGATGRKTHAAHGEHGTCRNCDAPLAGAFCQRCGQSTHIHRSLLHLGEELLHGMFHFDAKGWRTLPLLVVRPGLLTRRYIDGQRASHVSPLALFLFMVFLMFFVFSLTSVQPMPSLHASGVDRTELVDNVKEADKDLADAETELANARKSGESIGEVEAQLAGARVAQKVAQKVLQRFDEKAPAAAAAASSVASAAATPAASAADAERPIVVTGDGRWMSELQQANIDTGSARLDDGIRHALKNPELTIYKLKETASKYSFMLVPISLPFLWLMFFWRRGIKLYDHAVFSLYSLSFMSLLAVVTALLAMAHAKGLIVFLVLVLPPLHMFMQLRETYGLSIFSTLWRTAALLLVALVVSLLFVLFIIAMTMG